MPNSHLSFNLFNEPDDKVKPEDLRRVTEQLVTAIRSRDPRPADHRRRPQLGPHTDHGIARPERRGRHPLVRPDPRDALQGGVGPLEPELARPTWPLKERNGKIVDRETIRRTLFAPWQELEKKGVGMFVGEWGVHQHTPHTVALAWMRDMLGLLQGGRLGLGPVELRRHLRRLRKRPGGREVRERGTAASSTGPWSRSCRSSDRDAACARAGREFPSRLC